MLTATRPFSLIIFGASGHLAKIKIYPALYVLFLKKRLPASFSIVGYARTAMDTGAFRALVGEAVRADLEEVNATLLEEFLSHVHYRAGQYDKVDDFQALAAQLTELEGNEAAVRLAYLSIPPDVFGAVLENLSAGGVRNTDFRCILEKPVGYNLASFKVLKKQLMDSFKESEIYLLDHYLGKEAVRNLYYLRSGNPIFERVFDHELMHHVEVAAIESAGISSRAGYFDKSGTLRDMVQSHLLMALSLLTMRLGGEDDIQAGRYAALKEWSVAEGPLSEVIVQGQYEGYAQEKDVAAGSRSNTYVALRLQSRCERYKGIPFVIKTGKKLDRKETRISVQFKPASNALVGNAPNQLDVILQGEAGLKLHLQTKLGGSEPAFRPLVLADPLVCVGDCLPEHGLLLLEAINGIRRWFLTFEEVEASWALVDPLQTHLDDPQTPLVSYPAGSRGPAQADAWIAGHGLGWLAC
ncbi:MAG: hypothetical protein KBC95_00045 [Candidatus Peribacteraceae bacterium]|nr:hypothetical protein [Candidatus Peribacteraceae bacterium]